MTEVWRDAVGFEGLYEVSNLGRVKRVGRAFRSGKGRGGGARMGLIRKPQVNIGGYLCLVLWKDGKPIGKLVHVMVAEAFIGPQPDGCEVNHKDTDKQNCKDSNLEWLTRTENMQHASAMGLLGKREYARGEDHHNSKLTDEQVEEIRRLFVPRKYGAPRLAREFGVTHCTIYAILKGKTHKELEQ